MLSTFEAEIRHLDKLALSQRIKRGAKKKMCSRGFNFDLALTLLQRALFHPLAFVLIYFCNNIKMNNSFRKNFTQLQLTTYMYCVFKSSSMFVCVNYLSRTSSVSDAEQAS